MKVDTPFPPYASPLVNQAGVITEPWYRFLVVLFNRTGQEPGVQLENHRDQLNDIEMQLAGQVSIPTAAQASLTAALIGRLAQLEMLIHQQSMPVGTVTRQELQTLADEIQSLPIQKPSSEPQDPFSIEMTHSEPDIEQLMRGVLNLLLPTEVPKYVENALSYEMTESEPDIDSVMALFLNKQLPLEVPKYIESALAYEMTQAEQDIESLLKQSLNILLPPELAKFTDAGLSYEMTFSSSFE